MALLNDILTWTETLPDWQRDAARRLFQSEKGLSEDDYSELYALLKGAHGLPCTNGLSASPLASQHLPAGSVTGETVTLKAMRELTNVNRIASDQTLSFGDNGISIIYGGNGSGKSGYARVLKRACRARDQQEKVLPNAQNASARNEVPSAKFDIEIASASEEVVWRQDMVSPDKLSAIAVFDSKCARSYLTSEQDVAYLPYGLDIVENLANKVLPELTRRLDDEIARINVDTAPFSHLIGQTSVGRLISTLCHRTDQATLKSLGTLAESEKSRLEELKKALSEADPIAKANDLNLSAQRLKELGEKVGKPLAWVSDKALAKLQQLDQAADDAEAAEAKAAEALRSGEELLDGTGGKTWKLMFEAARRYSTEEAYPKHSFPHVRGARCSLCQEELSNAAGERLIRFEQYIKEDVAKAADEERKKLEVAKGKVEKADLSIGMDAAIASEIEKLAPSLIAVATAYHESIEDRRKSMLVALGTHEWSVIPAITESPRKAIRILAARQLRATRTLLKSANPQKRKELEAVQAELAARTALSQSLTAVLALLQRMKVKNALEYCKPALNTRAISNKSKELASQAVTNELKTALDREFTILGVGHIKTILKERSSRGKMLHQLVLDVPTTTKTDEVLSEGEQRAIALGSFLAELSLANHSCGIVFDDPVTSLDHKRREKVANRLVAEAKERQVIIFTHEVVFLHQLKEACKKQHVTFAACFLDSSLTHYGIVKEGLPWAHKSIGERFDTLEKEQRRLQSLPWPADPSVEMIGDIVRQYSFLRATIERVVQDCLLNGTVQRFKDYIEVKKLRDVIVLDQVDFDEISRLNQRCHDIVEAHDPSSYKDDAPPTPSELKTDIKDLRVLIQRVKDKRR